MGHVSWKNMMTCYTYVSKPAGNHKYLAKLQFQEATPQNKQNSVMQQAHTSSVEFNFLPA